MDIVKIIFLILHFIGIASLLGSFIVQMKDVVRGRGKVLPGMFHGALTMLITGLVLVLVAEFGDGAVNHMKIGIKLVVAAVITALVIVAGRRKDGPSSGLVGAIAALTTLNIAIAALWR